MTNTDNDTYSPADGREAILSVMLRSLAREAARQNPIQVVQTASGGFDVSLRLDGTYSSRSDADAVARFLTGVLLDAARPPAVLPASDAVVTPGSGLGDLVIAVGESAAEEDGDAA